MLLVVSATGCSGSSGDTGAEPTLGPIPSSTCSDELPSVPDRCFVPPTTEPVTYPTDPAKIMSVTLPPTEGKIGGADNRDDPTRRTATFAINVPAGARPGTIIGCLGPGTVTVKTVPDSQAFLTINCDVDRQAYSVLQVQATDNLTEPTSYQVTVTASAASRWDVALYATSKP